jgi:hypothetical protein
MLRKTVFFFFLDFVAQTVAFPTGDTIKANITALVLCKAELAFSHFRSSASRRIEGNIIFDQMVTGSINITK